MFSFVVILSSVKYVDIVQHCCFESWGVPNFKLDKEGVALKIKYETSNKKMCKSTFQVKISAWNIIFIGAYTACKKRLQYVINVVHAIYIIGSGKN